MKYLCLIYDDEREMGTMPRPDGEKMMAAYLDSPRASREQPLQRRRVETAATPTVRVRQSKVSTTDGPYAETKEQLGGFYMIDAKDLNDAIQVASRIPGALTGSVEVRPVRVFAQQESPAVSHQSVTAR
jgi:hypothetical protein